MELNYTDFNEMSLKQIEKLPRIGKKVALRIVEMRPFRSNNDLFKIKGLGTNTLKQFGIERVKKERKTWILMDDGIEYPSYCFAKHKTTGKLDFFWRISRENRIYL
jgi:hypothetical protein